LKRQNGFDYIKGLSCIAVVLIHYNFPGNMGIAIKAFCRFAVPVFLCVSGYFFLRNGKMEDTVVIKKIRHIFSLLMMSGVFYYVFAWIWNTQMSKGWNRTQFIQEKLLASKIVKLFITNDPFVYSHLWFLLGLLYCYAFASLYFAGSKRIKTIYVLAPFLLVGYAFLQEFGGLLGISRSVAIPGTNDRIYLYNLFCFRALPFFMFGMIIKERQESISKITLTTACLWLVVVVGGILAIVERFMIGEAQFFVGSYVMVAAMFVWAIKSEMSERALLCFIGRELSLYIYIFHIAVGKSFDLFVSKMHLWGTPLVNYGKTPIVLVVTVLMAYLLYVAKLLCKRNCRKTV